MFRELLHANPAFGVRRQRMNSRLTSLFGQKSSQVKLFFVAARRENKAVDKVEVG
jgi:hypothetical protein